MAANDEILNRIERALDAAREAISGFIPGAVDADHKSGGRGPVTEADHVADLVLHEMLVRDGEGWLSEESADDPVRLTKRRVWVVDPLDGTREFVEGIPEWCISVGLVEEGRAVAGGICNPATGEMFLGSLDSGVIRNGVPVHASSCKELEGILVLASRSEVRRGEWNEFENRSFSVLAMGSVAYKLARVAAGLADATWTLSPKNEWDIAAGVALVQSGGGRLSTLEGSTVLFNQPKTLRSGLIASGRDLYDEIKAFLSSQIDQALANQASNSISR
jgi:myo-inositol-1(or 4)-monophosphatase